MICTKSWCQKVLDLLDLSFAEPLTQMMVICYLLQYISQTFHCFLQTREEIGGKLVDFYGICKISPEDLPKPS